MAKRQDTQKRCEAAALRQRQQAISGGGDTQASIRPIDLSRSRHSARASALLAATLMIVATIVVAVLVQPTSAAQSEVWSEAEGVNLKYSTNHDDLLSTKGSELSLSTDQQQRHVEPATGAGAAAGQASDSESTGGEESSPAEKSSASTSGGSGESESSGEQPQQSPSSESNEGEEQHSTADGEQGTDSSSRQSEKVPPTGAGRVQSYSSSSQHSFKSSHRTPSPLSSSSSSSFGSQDADVESSAPTTRKSTASKLIPANQGGSSSDDDEDSSSASPGASDVPAAADAEDMSNTMSSDERPSKGAYGMSKFSQPSRSFKEAVRMGASPAARQEESSPSSPINDDDESSSSSSSQSKDEEQSSSRRPVGGNQSADGDGGESSGPSESSLSEDDEQSAAARSGPSASSSSSGKQARQNMIDFDQFSSPMQPNARQQEDAPPAAADVGDESGALFDAGPAAQRNFGANSAPFMNGANVQDQEDEPNNPAFRSPFFDNSVQSSRGALAASTPHKERVVPTGSAASAAGGQQLHSQRQPHSQQQQQSQASPLPGSGKEPQAYKQLAYFRNVKEQPSRAAPASRPTFASFRTSAAADEPDSPDNVRDNFISPGHFPGSMPHLTQAASEIAAKADTSENKPQPVGAAVAGAATTTKSADEQSAIKLERAASSQSSAQSAAAAVAPPTTAVAGEKEQQAASEPVLSSVAPAIATTSDNSNKARAGGDASAIELPVTVTPVPEAQLESQQIMAPILVSTTTMAPMVSSSSSATEGPSSSSSTTLAPTSSSSQAPSLKRFKFRKYR